MTLEFLQSEMIRAMKNGLKFRKTVISSIIGAVKNEAIKEHCQENIPESLVNKVVLKELKTAREMFDTCPKDRDDLLEDYDIRIAIVLEFAPQMMDREQIEVEVIRILESEGIDPEIQTRGRCMRAVMPILNDKADGKLINDVVTELVQ